MRVREWYQRESRKLLVAAPHESPDISAIWPQGTQVRILECYSGYHVGMIGQIETDVACEEDYFLPVVLPDTHDVYCAIRVEAI